MELPHACVVLYGGLKQWEAEVFRWLSAASDMLGESDGCLLQ